MGAEAVIDKDRASGLLAERLGADALLLLTDVDAVYRGWGTLAEAAQILERTSGTVIVGRDGGDRS